ncbi:MAG TPA: HNH endonuclease [Candidatus Nanoarchaeia archaeon]|nr:HNH endonuclease [Candidatus Nanoarchaeia archaeon]
MKNIFDAFGEFFESHRLFGEPKPRDEIISSRAKRFIADITSDELERYAQHKDQSKSIFNKHNRERLVHYKAERMYLILRDMRKCGYCKDEDAPLQPDHIIPYNKYPVTHLDNLVMACIECNNGKSDRNIFGDELRKVLDEVHKRNDNHFPRRKYKEYRIDYGVLVRKIML